MLTPMSISQVVVDSQTNSPIVVLKEINGDRILPIWIGLLEADAIASVLEGVTFSRPMTHDLLKTVLESSDFEITKVEVNDLKNNTYYALIHLRHNDENMTIDARPSDALAISLRVGAPIYVAEAILDNSVQIEMKAEPEDTSEEGKKWQELLEKMDPDDFGNT